MGKTLSLLTAPGVLAQVRHVTPVRPRAARGLVADVYGRLARDFGMLAPPVILHSPVPPLLAACWLMLSESLLASGTVTRAAKEAVATEVSAANACPYCVDVHSATLHALTTPTPALTALTAWTRTTTSARTVTPPPSLTPRTGAPASWAAGSSSGVAAEGGASGSRVAGGWSAGFGDDGDGVSASWAAGSPSGVGAEGGASDSWGVGSTVVGLQGAGGPGGEAVRSVAVAELVGVVVTFQYVNRMVNVFLGDSPLPPGVPRGAYAMRMFGRVMRPAARRAMAPGSSLDLLPDAPLPGDLGWAATVPNVGGAFGRAAAVIEEYGRRSVPDEVRELVAERVGAWEGEPPGLGRRWVREAVEGLPARHRAAGRLALLTALASYQVDADVVADFRRAVPDERALIEVTAWASLTAARRVGAWCAAPVPNVPIAD